MPTKGALSPGCKIVSGFTSCAEEVNEIVEITKIKIALQKIFPISSHDCMRIKLTKGLFVEVDDELFEELNQWKWYAGGHKNYPYATRSEPNSTGDKKIRMHRFIMNPKPHELIDHIDRNTLNNKRQNLRICTTGQNKANSRGSKNPSGFKGVFKRKKYVAMIVINGELTYLGSFIKAEDAALAYDKRAIEVFGEFALTNF